ncbi:MAG: hypothetical protein PHY23_06375 [Oscillospiraceae bacterium]|nr:hypothetical protein [Oscillospiraceae bacterium]
MNEMKKIIYLQGTLLMPLTVGSCAYISHGGQVVRTSRVVAIREISSQRVGFETLNSHYCVELSPVPLSAVMPAYSRCAAA